MMRRILSLAGLLCLLANAALAQSIGQTGSFTLGSNQSVNLTQVGSSNIALGQTTMASSLPVVIASNQSAIPTTTAASTTGGATHSQTSAVGASLVAKASAGSLYGFEVTSGATAGFVMIHDATSKPADGAVTPAKCYTLPANSTIGASWDAIPVNMTTGITLVFSTTGCFSQTSTSSTAFLAADTL